METKGLCVTCEESRACIFRKGQPAVWLCEEFSYGTGALSRSGQIKVKRVVHNEVTESE